MAPKKLAVAEVVDTGPKLRVVYSVARVSALSASSPAEAAETPEEFAAKAPQCVVTVRGPTLKEPAVSPPCALNEVGAYRPTLAAESEASLDSADALLSTLINGRVHVQVAIVSDEEGATPQPVATAVLDLLPAATKGVSAVEARLPLQSVQSAPDSGAEGAFELSPDANITVSVAFFRDVAKEGNVAEAPAEEPAEQQPLERKPFRFVSPQEVEETTVIEVAPSKLASVPSTLTTAATPAGGFEILAAAAWNAGNGVSAGATSAAGALDGETVTWSAAKRSFVPRHAFLALQDALTEGKSDLASALCVEVARYVVNTDAASDPAFANYHASAAVPTDAIRTLAAPGCDTVTFAVTMDQAHSAAGTAANTGDDAAASHRALPPTVLPPAREAGAKAKPCEAAAPPSEDGSPQCCWLGAALDVTLRLTNPVVPAWKPPPKPTKTLREIVPAREIPKAEPATFATELYKSQVAGLALALAKEYVDMFGEEAARIPEGAAKQDVLGQRHRDLVFELNRSGRYLEMRNRLKQSVVAIVQERFRRDLTKDEMIDIYNALYTYMLDEMHAVINGLRGEEKPRAPDAVPLAEESRTLEQLAAECEVAGDMERAEKLHQQRLLDDSQPDIWYSYGMFCMRSGNVSRAEESFRRALALDGAHRDALLALACVLWHNGKNTDSMFLEDSIAITQAATEADSGNAVAWALLAMLYATENAPVADPKTAVRNAQHKARTVAASLAAAESDAAADAGGVAPPQHPMANHPFLQLEILLLELQLGALAQDVHEIAAKEQGADSMQAALSMCKAQAAGLQGDVPLAVSVLKQAVKYAGFAAAKVKPLVLLGHINTTAGNITDAKEAYEAALQADALSCPLDVYIRLGNMYLREHQPELAADVFGQACMARPCASSWMGAGVAFLRMGELADADLALTEANIHDNRNAMVWAYIALVHLLVERHREGGQALEYAFKNGFNNVELLREIGGVYAKQGMYDEAVPVLRRASAATTEPHFETLVTLADALSNCNELPAAVAQWTLAQSAAVAAGDEQNADMAAAAISQLKSKLGEEVSDAFNTEVPVAPQVAVA